MTNPPVGMAEDVIFTSVDETMAPEDPILITPKEGTKRTAYTAALSGGQWTLRSSSFEEPVTPSNLFLLHPTQIERLRNADIKVLISSKSGEGLAESAFSNLLLPLFNKFNIPFSGHKTFSKTSHKSYFSGIEISSLKENIIVVFGGDTVIFDLLNSLSENHFVTPEHRFTLCPIPCGTGNALATSLGIKNIPIGISRIFGLSKTSREPERLPLLKITIREQAREHVIFASVVCSWGLHASLVANSNEPEMRREYGAQRFQVAGRRLLHPKPHVYHGDLEVDDIPVKTKEHTYLLISHVSHLEPTFPIAPEQSPLQNTLTLIEIGPQTGEELMGVMRAVYAGGKHTGMEDVLLRTRVRKVRFTVDEEDVTFRRICIDGEIFTVDNGSSIDIEMADMKAKISV